MLPLHLQITECHFAAVSVEPTDCYYQKVSEELEKIVHEVKEKEEERPLSGYYEKVSEELEKIAHQVKEKEEEKPLSDGEEQLLIKAAFSRETHRMYFCLFTWHLHNTCSPQIEVNLTSSLYLGYKVLSLSGSPC